MDNSVIPIEREIRNLKRQRDDLEWEGGNYEHIERQIKCLVQKMIDGEKWYVSF